MSFVFGKSSKAKLESLHHDLKEVAYGALGLTRVDFTVVQTARSHDQQLAYVKAGKSRTYNSRHVPRPHESLVFALDVAPWVDGAAQFGEEDWPLYYDIAEAFGRSAYERQIPLDWGGCWQRIDLKDFTAAKALLMKENFVDAFYARSNPKRLKSGKHPLVDGPHFQLPWNKYP